MSQSPDTHASSSLTTAGNSEDVAAPRRTADDAPLQTKLTLLVMLAAVGGTVVGSVEAYFGHQVWPLALGLALVITAVIKLGHRWLCMPWGRLSRQVDVIRMRRRPGSLRNLPVERDDEIGRLARAIHKLSQCAIRDHHEATRLRKSIDDRIVRATGRATRQLRDLAMRDPLTQLGNRRFLEEHIEPLIDSVRQSNEDVVALMIDVDNFKQVNDVFGHGVGDQMLVLLAGMIRAYVRHDDLAVRLGGDEMLVLMPGCTMEQGEQLAWQLITLFGRQARMMMTKPLPVGLSIGLASLQRDGAQTGSELIDMADANLYTAKRAGKGRSCSNMRPQGDHET